MMETFAMALNPATRLWAASRGALRSTVMMPMHVPPTLVMPLPAAAIHPSSVMIMTPVQQMAAIF